MSKLMIVIVVTGLIFISGCSSKAKKFPSDIHSTDFSLSKVQQMDPLEEPILQNQDDLELRGQGIKSLFMIKVFTAGLYLPKEVPSENALNVTVPKCISVVFYAKIKSRDFANYTVENMKPNLKADEFASLSEQIVRMRELFPNIAPNDSLALSYKPGMGTSFIHNGEVRGTIEGELFSKAIFSTWLGAKPFDRFLKKQILGGEKA